MAFTLTLRTTNGSRLTHVELDNNFLYLKDRDIVDAYTSGNLLILEKEDGGTFEVPLSAVTSTLTYTNLTPMPEDVGGWTEGSTFSGLTMQQMWDGLLYPYQYPSFTTFTRTNLNNNSVGYEVGEVIDIGNQTFSWSFENGFNVDDGIANSIKIEELDPVTTIADSLVNDVPDTSGTEVISLTNDMGYNTIGQRTLYRASALNSLGEPITASISSTWRVKFYYGKSLLTQLTASAMTGLTSELKLNNIVQNSYGVGDTSPNLTYLYICIPSQIDGSPSGINQPCDIFGGTACLGNNVPYETTNTVSGGGNTITINNEFGVPVEYTVYRSTNSFASALTFYLCYGSECA